MDTHGRKKFTWSRQLEYLSTPRGQLASHLVDPNTSYPLICGRQFVKDDPNVKFAIVATSLVGSFDPCDLLNNNSFVSDP
jgi:hypothetical protein